MESTESTTTPEKEPPVSQKKKSIRSPLLDEEKSKKIELKLRESEIDLTLIFLYLYDTLNRLIDNKRIQSVIL